MSELHCMVCHSPLRAYFEKDFQGLSGLGVVAYDRCDGCGFVQSRTHARLSEAEWEDLNYRCHADYQGQETPPERDPRWLERIHNEAASVHGLWLAGVLPRELPWVDFGCGDGKLAEQLGRRGVPVLKFDRYMGDASYLTEEQLAARRYGVVLNTAVFEHARSRPQLDEIAGLVAPRGVLALHTLVRQEIPPDPGWFYLLAAHCSFFTNRSMQMLFDQWNFYSSLYHVESRLWFWFREESEPLRRFLEQPERFVQGEIRYQRGFADYWK